MEKWGAENQTKTWVWEDSILCPETSTKNAVQEFGLLPLEAESVEGISLLVVSLQQAQVRLPLVPNHLGQNFIFYKNRKNTLDLTIVRVCSVNATTVLDLTNYLKAERIEWFIVVLWKRFRFRFWKSFGSGFGSGFGVTKYLAQFSNKKKVVQNLAFTMSESALFPRKLVSHLWFFDFLNFLVDFVLDPDTNWLRQGKKLRFPAVPVPQHWWFIEDQAFSPAFNLDPPPTSPVSKLYLFLSLPVCRKSNLWRGGRSQIIRRRENLILYK
jgi:hypothetical protein